MDPAPGYMHPAFREDLRGVLLDASAFLPAEEEARELFAGLTDDLWAMAEELALWGADIVVITRGAEGAAVYDAAARRRWWVRGRLFAPLRPAGSRAVRQRVGLVRHRNQRRAGRARPVGRPAPGPAGTFAHRGAAGLKPAFDTCRETCRLSLSDAANAFYSESES